MQFCKKRCIIKTVLIQNIIFAYNIMKLFASLLLTCFIALTCMSCNKEKIYTAQTCTIQHVVSSYSLEKEPTMQETGSISGECILCGAIDKKEIELITINSQNISEYFDIAYEDAGIMVNITCLPKNKLKEINNIISLKEPIYLYLPPNLSLNNRIEPLSISFYAKVNKYEQSGDLHSTYSRNLTYKYDILNPPTAFTTLSLQIGDLPTLNMNGDLTYKYTYTYTMEIHVSNSKFVVLKTN